MRLPFQHLRHEILNPVAAATFAASIAVGMTACAPLRQTESDPNQVEPSVSAPVTPGVIAPALSPEKQTRDELFEYVSGSERNDKIGKVVTNLSAQIIAKGPLRIGYFDFYNTGKDKWGRWRNDGWGIKQHYANYGRSSAYVGVGSYQTDKGTIDTRKGFQSLTVDVPGTNQRVSFAGPSFIEKLYDKKLGKEKGWTVSIIENPNRLAQAKNPTKAQETVTPTRTQVDNESVPDAAAAKVIDAKALKLVKKAVKELLG